MSVSGLRVRAANRFNLIKLSFREMCVQIGMKRSRYYDRFAQIYYLA